MRAIEIAILAMVVILGIVGVVGLVSAANTAPALSAVSPANNTATQNVLQPWCHVAITDLNGDTMTIRFYENSTGTWILRQTNSTAHNGTYWWHFIQANSYISLYYWRVSANDGQGGNTTILYHFRTQSHAQIYTTDTDTLNCYKLKYPVTVDGQITDLDEWNDAECMKWYYYPFTSNTNGYVYVYAKYSATNLYILIDLTPDNNVADYVCTDVWLDENHNGKFGWNIPAANEANIWIQTSGSPVSRFAAYRNGTWNYVAAPDNHYGAIGFHRSMNAAYNHMIIEYVIPLSLINESSTMGLGFRSTGTMSPTIWNEVNQSFDVNGAPTKASCALWTDLVMHNWMVGLNASFDHTRDGYTATFEDLSNGTNTIVNWSWDFGDGNTSYDQNPTNTYAAPGNYSVTLIVTDEFGLTNTTIVYVLIPTVAEQLNSLQPLFITIAGVVIVVVALGSFVIKPIIRMFKKF